MKKSNKKQIPKVRLPKFAPGGNANFNESMYDSSQSTSTQGTKDAYNEKRSKNMFGNAEGTGASSGQKMAIAGAALDGGMNAYNVSQTPGMSTHNKNEAYGKSIENTEQGVVSAINPVFGMIHGATSKIMAPMTAKATATDAEGNLVNRKQAKNQAIGRAFADPMAMIPTMISTGFNRNKYADQIESSAKADIASQQAEQAAYAQQQAAAQQQQNDFINNSIQSGMANYQKQNQNSGTVQYGAGGIQYANGGNGQINAEVEKEENSVAPNGQFTQFNGPSHASGGIQTDIPQGSKIFSDKLKMPGTKKTFAELNKSNNTNKEDKILSSDKHGNISKHTAMLMSMAKTKNSDSLFANQEAFKQAKVQAYAKRMGVTLPSTDNEQMEPQGMSEQSEGEYSSGGIHIDPSKKGTFTAAASKHGKSVQAFASQVLANKENYSPAMVKKANFAHNAAGWKHEMGGVQLPYYNTPTYGDGGPAVNVQGLTKPQYQQAQTDSMTLYKSGLNNRFAFQQGQNTDPEARRLSNTINTINKYKGNNEIDVVEPISGEYYDSPTYKTMGKPAQFQKPSMTPWQALTPPVEGSGVRVLNKPLPNTPAPSTANWQLNQQLRGGGNKLTYADGTTQMVAPKVVKTTGFKYGGINLPKFENGNKYGEKDPQDLELKGNPQIQEVPTFDYQNTNKTPNTKEKFDWNNLASNAATFAANNAGNIYNLSRYNKPEVEKYERAKASYLDPSAALRDVDQEAHRATYDLANRSVGQAGGFLSNRVALATQNIMNKDRIRQQYANANAGIGNQVNQFNTDIAMREVIANAQNRARNRSGKGEAIGSMGSNIANQMRDSKGDKMDQKTLDMMTEYYNNPEFRKAMEKSGFKIKNNFGY